MRFIRRGKALGFSLDEIGELVRLTSSANAERSEVRGLASRRLAEVERQLQDLTAVRDTLRALVTDCSGKGPVSGCPIVERVLGEEH